MRDQWFKKMDCRFPGGMDNEPIIGYHIYGVNNEGKNELTIYSDFFEDKTESLRVDTEEVTFKIRTS